MPGFAGSVRIRNLLARVQELEVLHGEVDGIREGQAHELAVLNDGVAPVGDLVILDGVGALLILVGVGAEKSGVPVGISQVSSETVMEMKAR